MSLDIYLYSPKELKCECGKVHSINSELLYSANITHNLNQMADKAGIYEALWNGEENGIKTGKQLADILNPAIRDMDLNPGKYRPFNASNGWGTYEVFVPWLEELRDRCVMYPDCLIEISK